MSAFAIRLSALLFMLIDHVGVFFSLPHGITLTLRFLGRIAFPLFAFLIVNGFRHTKHPRQYLLRLLVFAVVSEPFLDFARTYTLWDPAKQNVFLTLLLGLLTLIVLENCKKRTPLWGILGCLAAALLALTADFLTTDYGSVGVLLILLFHLAWGKKPWLIVVSLLFSLRLLLWHIGRLICSKLPLLNLLIDGAVTPKPGEMAWLTLGAALAVLPILLYNSKKGWCPKNGTAALLLQYGFYLFYPLHLLVLAILAAV